MGPSRLPVRLEAAFIGAALLGGLLELTNVRRLYERPLDTLLAGYSQARPGSMVHLPGE